MRKRSRKVRFVPTSLAQFILRLTVCKFKFSAMLRELKIISGKNLLIYSNSLSNMIINFHFLVQVTFNSFAFDGMFEYGEGIFQF